MRQENDKNDKKEMKRKVTKKYINKGENKKSKKR